MYLCCVCICAYLCVSLCISTCVAVCMYIYACMSMCAHTHVQENKFRLLVRWFSLCPPSEARGLGLARGFWLWRRLAIRLSAGRRRWKRPGALEGARLAWLPVLAAEAGLLPAAAASPGCRTSVVVLPATPEKAHQPTRPHLRCLGPTLLGHPCCWVLTIPYAALPGLPAAATSLIHG